MYWEMTKTVPSGKLAINQSFNSSTPGCPDFIKIHSDGDSCCEACKKYRPSVHNNDFSVAFDITNAVPECKDSHQKRKWYLECKIR